jgi:hypothetical protein
VLQSDDEDANEKAPPEPDEVSEVLVKTEQYLANKVLVESDHEYLRLSCRNYNNNKKCAIWSAKVIATKTAIIWASIALLRVRTVKYLTRVHTSFEEITLCTSSPSFRSSGTLAL